MAEAQRDEAELLVTQTMLPTSTAHDPLRRRSNLLSSTLARRSCCALPEGHGPGRCLPSPGSLPNGQWSVRAVPASQGRLRRRSALGLAHPGQTAPPLGGPPWWRRGVTRCASMGQAVDLEGLTGIQAHPVPSASPAWMRRIGLGDRQRASLRRAVSAAWDAASISPSSPASVSTKASTTSIARPSMVSGSAKYAANSPAPMVAMAGRRAR